MSFSEEVEQGLMNFVDDLFRDDELGAVIRAHIRIEHLIRESVKLLAPHPEHLKRLNLDYGGYVSIAQVLGLDDRFARPFRAMGKIRNDFAHKPDTKLTRQVVNNLYNSLDPIDKKQVQKLFQKIGDKFALSLDAERFEELPPQERFKLIALAIWAMAKSSKMVASGAAVDNDSD